MVGIFGAIVEVLLDGLLGQLGEFAGSIGCFDNLMGWRA